MPSRDRADLGGPLPLRFSVARAQITKSDCKTQGTESQNSKSKVHDISSRLDAKDTHPIQGRITGYQKNP